MRPRSAGSWPRTGGRGHHDRHPLQFLLHPATVPCELWFLNRAKPQEHRDKVLMIDARNVYRKVTRKIYDFSPEQQQNLLAIVLAVSWPDRQVFSTWYPTTAVAPLTTPPPVSTPKPKTVKRHQPSPTSPLRSTH